MMIRCILLADMEDLRAATRRLIDFHRSEDAQRVSQKRLAVDITQIVEALCKDIGFSMSRLSRRMGMARVHVWGVCHGYRPVTPYFLDKLGGFLDEWQQNEARARQRQRQSDAMKRAREGRKERARRG